jgi:hypothetical protein
MALVSNSMTNRTDMEAALAERDWTAYTKGLLRGEMAKRQITYRMLADKLAVLGITETEVNLRNKISRGGFTACLVAMGVTALRLDD